MKILIKFAFVATLAMAAPAASQQGAKEAGLKGALGQERTPADPQAKAAAAPTSTLILPGLSPTPAQAAEQCRATCAQNYYFCLSSDAPDNCPQAWGQCRLSCNTILTGG